MTTTPQSNKPATTDNTQRLVDDLTVYRRAASESLKVAETDQESMKHMGKIEVIDYLLKNISEGVYAAPAEPTVTAVESPLDEAMRKRNAPLRFSTMQLRDLLSAHKLASTAIVTRQRDITELHHVQQGIEQAIHVNEEHIKLQRDALLLTASRLAHERHPAMLDLINANANASN